MNVKVIWGLLWFLQTVRLYICNDLQKTGIGCFLQVTLDQKYTFTHIKHSVNGVESSTLFWFLVFLTKQRLINYSWSWLTATGTLEVQGEDLRRIVDLHKLWRSLVVFSDVSPLRWGLLEVPNWHPQIRGNWLRGPGTTGAQACHEWKTTGTPASLSTVKWDSHHLLSGHRPRK